MPTCEIVTSDTTFAAALLAHGGRLVPDWKCRDGRVEWHISEVPGDAVDAYKSGRDRFSAFARNRRMLCDISKSLAPGNSAGPKSNANPNP